MTAQSFLFDYPNEAVDYLSHRDALLGAAIVRIGPVRRTVIPDLYTALLHSITGQQISANAHRTVWTRVADAHDGSVEPKATIALGAEGLRACGISGRKAAYMLAAAEAFSNGTIDAHALALLPDEAVVERLTVLPGVGRWTAEMLLLFSLMRMDVLSYGDFGIRKGIMRLYSLDTLDKGTYGALRTRFSPFNSVASLYFWELAAGR